MNLPCYVRYADRHTYMGVKYLGFNILGADSVGAIFSGGRLHLKAIKVCIPNKRLVYYDHENNVNIIIKGHT